MYQTVSEEMIQIFSTIADYGSLVGNLVNRYRFENKDLSKLRQMFFERVSNTPKLEKYLDYYRWLDTSLNVLLANLVPATAITFDSETLVQSMVEEYIFNTNRYTSKFPTLEFKQSDPEGALKGVNELLYDWEFGHAPLNDEQDDNCLWWDARAKRDGTLTSGDSAADSDRQTILNILNNQNNASAPNLSGSDGSYQGSTFALRKFARPYKLTVEKQKDLHGGGNTSDNKKVGFWDAIRQRPTPSGQDTGALISIKPSESTLESFEECDDNSTLRLGKRKYSFSAQTSIDGNALSSANKFKGGMIFPFSLYSSSINNGAMGDLLDFQSNLDVTNLHQDSYGPFNEVPIQGPFTEKYVGGRAYRHVFTNFTLNNTTPNSQGDRLEGWMLSASSDQLDLKNPTTPKSIYFRDGLAKRPVNITNIQQTTGAASTDYINPATGTVIGNYSKSYELVMTNGRSINNRYLTEAGGDYPFTASIESAIVSGAIEFTLPRRDLIGKNYYIIVNRFSSPGDPATMCEGMLDVASGEYSVYNALPWRNLSVRDPLYQLYSDHANQFGYFSDAFTVAAYDIAGETYPGGSSSVNTSDYSGTGSYHKVNRNGRLKPFLSGTDGFANSKLLEFNGSSYYVAVTDGGDAPADLDFTPNVDSFTLSAWISTTAAAGSIMGIAGNSPSSTYQLRIYLNSGKVIAYVGGSTNYSISDGTVNDGEWHHVALVSNGSTHKIYVDGVAQTNEGTCGSTMQSNIDFLIGARRDGNNTSAAFYFDGYMDELSVWNAALTTDGIKEIYEAFGKYIYQGASGPNNLTGHSRVNNLVSWWRADGDISFNTKSIAFDGDDGSSQLTVADAANLSFGDASDDSPFSISAWIKPTSFSNVFTIFDKNNVQGVSPEKEYGFWIGTDGKMYFVLYDEDGSNWILQKADDALSTDEWTHVCATYDATEATSGIIIYANGAPVDMTPNTVGSYTAMHPTDIDVNIGRLYSDSPAYVSEGFIDEVALYDKKLSSGEVTELYNDGLTLDLSSFSAVSNIISWWRMGDEATGVSPDYTIPDQIGSNDAEMNNFQGDSTSGVVEDAVPSTNLTDHYGSNDGEIINDNMIIDNDGDPATELSVRQVYNTPTKKRYDNWFVQHQIPQTDLQYAWITASIINDYTGPAAYGFEEPNFSNAGFASTDLTFTSASTQGSYYRISNDYRYFGATKAELDGDSDRGEFIPVDFAGLNTIVYEQVNTSTNLLGTIPAAGTYKGIVELGAPGPDAEERYINPTLGTMRSQRTWVDYAGNPGFAAGTPAALNAILLNRSGPYGGANWKLYRKDSHAVVRAQRNENRLSFIVPGTITNLLTKIVMPIRNVHSAIEPPINSKYRPIDFDISIKPSIDGGREAIKFKQSYLNNFVKFSEKIERDFDLNNGGYFKEVHGYKPKKLAYDSLTALITEDAISPETNPINSVNLLITSEITFPREKFTYLVTHRQRDNYENGYWKNSREKRDEIGSASVNPFIDISDSLNPGLRNVYNFDIKLSIWPLDARIDFLTSSPGRLKIDADEGVNGSPQSYYPIVSGTLKTRPGILQNNVMQLGGIADFKYVAAGFTKKPSSVQLLPTYNRKIPGIIGDDLTHEYKFGGTKWESADQSGIKPFFNTYDDYVEDIKRMGKSYSIIPEFIISDHMDYYLNAKSGDFLAANTASFSITGSTLSSSSENNFMATYSHTDFLQTFKLVKHDYKNKLRAQKIELECEGLIKFLPYDGFYPADRTVQLTKLFWESYRSSFAITGALFNPTPAGDVAPEVGIADELTTRQAGYSRPVWNTLFSPGVLYNSIKSGMAVDYPAHTKTSAPLKVSGSPNQRTYGVLAGEFLKDIPRIATPFDYRVPFETLVDPEGNIPGVQFIWNEPHPSGSLNVTASLNGADKNDYKLAMHNFLASTIDFFKPNGQLLTLAGVSDIDSSFGKGLVEGREYKMRIVCSNAKLRDTKTISSYLTGVVNVPNLFKASFEFNPQTIVMYAQTGSDKRAGSSEILRKVWMEATSDYYGCAYGPPCNNQSIGAGYIGPLDKEYTKFPLYGSASYEPFTPAYYDGYSHIELTYKCDFEGDSLENMVNKFTSSFSRSCGFSNVGPQSGYNHLTTPSSLNEMSLSASLNYLQVVPHVNPVRDAQGNVIQFDSDIHSKGSRLVIQPKWETPVLDFKNVQVELPTIGSGSVARGMWHQYGSIPSPLAGIYLQIQDLAESEKANPRMTGSLRDALGLPEGEFKIGQIAERKTISEAIIAIPSIIKNPANEDSSNKFRFGIDKEIIELALMLLNDGRTETYNKRIKKNPEHEPSKEIVDMVTKMQKYVIPPTYDFLTNKQVAPFAMFIFEFSVDLSQQDLANIWQNLSPDIGVKAIKTRATLPVNVFKPGMSEIFGGKALMNGISNRVQWQVFKVKQKSAWNYFDKTAQIEKETKDDINVTGITKSTIPNYSYNWPYDFFSLVELGKINAKATFGDPKDMDYIAKSVPPVIQPKPTPPPDPPARTQFKVGLPEPAMAASSMAATTATAASSMAAAAKGKVYTSGQLNAGIVAPGGIAAGGSLQGMQVARPGHIGLGASGGTLSTTGGGLIGGGTPTGGLAGGTSGMVVMGPGKKEEERTKKEEERTKKEEERTKKEEEEAKKKKKKKKPEKKKKKKPYSTR